MIKRTELPVGFLEERCCSVCYQEALKLVMTEHPQWLTKKSKRLAWKYEERAKEREQKKWLMSW